MSLFGRREIADLKADKQRLATKVERLEEEKADLATLAEGRQAVIRQQASELEQLRQKAGARGVVAQQRGNALGRLSHRLGNVEAEYGHIDTYAAGMERRLDRALKACARYRAELAAQYRVNDFLGQQLLDSVSGHDPRLQVLADDVKNGEVTA
jgi:chromosome segregation ATPase